MEERKLVLRDGHPMFCRIWEAENPVATVHINHGMAEHSLRYTRFALFLNKLGFSVYAQDHRGHGLTKAEGEEGWFADEGGWELVLGDAWEIDCLAREEHPGLEHFLFGHSMGSFIARCSLSRHPRAWAGAALCGTGFSQGLKGAIGRIIARKHVRENGARKPDKMLNMLSFGSYVRHFGGSAGKPMVWLSRDEAEVRKYEEDPLCGFTCSSSFFIDLVDGIDMANDPAEAAKLPKDLPLLIISGDEDPVGDYGKGVRKTAELYRRAGCDDVRLVLRPGDRHELLNEIDREAVMGILGDFYLGILGRREHE